MSLHINDLLKVSTGKLDNSKHSSSNSDVLRLCLLIFCIFYLTYVLVLSSFIYPKNNECHTKTKQALVKKNEPNDANEFYVKSLKEDDLQEKAHGINKRDATHYKHEGIVYMLIWTSGDKEPFHKVGEGRRIFTQNNCVHSNCYLTRNFDYLDKITSFDAIIFNSPGLSTLDAKDFPERRQPNQKYIFVSKLPAASNRICNPVFDDFFNLTWSYKLDSDIPDGIIVKNNLLQPKVNMPWVKYEHMTVKDEYVIAQSRFRKKLLAAVWVSPKCMPNSTTTHVAKNIQAALRDVGLTLDIYGDCGNYKCATEHCVTDIEDRYYFNLVFEEFICPHYVSSLLKHTLNQDMILIVFGGADYKWFLPENSYLNAGKTPASAIAAAVKEAVTDEKKYLSYFKWKLYYSYHLSGETTDTNSFCRLCEIVQDRNYRPVQIERFTHWWNYPSCYNNTVK